MNELRHAAEWDVLSHREQGLYEAERQAREEAEWTPNPERRRRLLAFADYLRGLRRAMVGGAV